MIFIRKTSPINKAHPEIKITGAGIAIVKISCWDLLYPISNAIEIKIDHLQMFSSSLKFK